MQDTLTYTDQLTKAGVPKAQAEAHAKAVYTMTNENLVSKMNLKDTEVALRADMQKMESGIRADMQKMESGIRADMQKMESSIRADMQKMESSIRLDMQKMDAKLDGLKDKMLINLGTVVFSALILAIAYLEFRWH